MLKYVLFLGLCITITLKAAVINVTVLEKKHVLGPSKKVYCISHRHLRPWSLPKRLTYEKAQKLVHDQAIVLKSFFKKLEAAAPTRIVLEASEVEEKKAQDQALIATLLCTCILERNADASCLSENKTLLTQNVAEQTALDSIVFLTHFLQNEKLHIIDPRKNLNVVLQILMMLMQMSQANYPNAVILAKKCHLIPGATLKQPVNRFTRELIKDINQMIQTAHDTLALTTNSENKRAISDAQKEFEAYKKLWDDFLIKLKSLSKKSILDIFIYYGKKYQADVEKLIQALDSYEFLPSLDHELLKIILSPDAPENIILNVGGLHTMKLVEMLTKEGYEVIYDSGFFCDGQNLAFSITHYQECFRSDSIQELSPEQLEKILNEAFTAQTHYAHYKEEL